MGALDKLNQRANITADLKNNVINEKSSDIQKNQAIEKKQTALKPEVTVKKKNEVVTPVQSKTAKVVSGKHPGGRPKREGSFKKVNLSIPEDVYNKIKEQCGGNMTFYINKVLREKVELM